eukprot:4152863-Pleurochrysis_carterae.AAC.1
MTPSASKSRGSPPSPLVYEAAHEPLPGESLFRRCRWCKAAPFATVEEFESERARWRELAGNQSKEGK